MKAGLIAASAGGHDALVISYRASEKRELVTALFRKAEDVADRNDHGNIPVSGKSLHVVANLSMVV